MAKRDTPLLSKAYIHEPSPRGAARRVRAVARRLCRCRRAARASFARQAQSLGLTVAVAKTAAECARGADILVTCTPSTTPILHRADIAPGCLIAAVGTDSPGKHELAPGVMAAALVVPDDLGQAVEMGDTHHAVRAGVMTPDSIHAELRAIVSGRSAGRTSPDHLFIFDSTGMAIEYLAAADLAFTHASRDEHAVRFALSEGM